MAKSKGVSVFHIFSAQKIFRGNFHAAKSITYGMSGTKIAIFLTILCGLQAHQIPVFGAKGLVFMRVSGPQSKENGICEKYV